MDGGAWWAAVHEVAKSWTRLSDFTFSFTFHCIMAVSLKHTSTYKMPILKSSMTLHIQGVETQTIHLAIMSDMELIHILLAITPQVLLPTMT